MADCIMLYGTSSKEQILTCYSTGLNSEIFFLQDQLFSKGESSVCSII